MSQSVILDGDVSVQFGGQENFRTEMDDLCYLESSLTRLCSCRGGSFRMEFQRDSGHCTWIPYNQINICYKKEDLLTSKSNNHFDLSF